MESTENDRSATLSVVKIRAALLFVPVLIASCSVYDPSLLEGSGGAGGASTSTGKGGAAGVGGATGSGGTGQGGSASCMSPMDCPGADTECSQRSCEMGACGVVFANAGTKVSAQVTGDCQQVVCDGMGDTTTEIDDSDTPNDGKECTTDSCSMGNPVYTPVAESTACTQGGKVCNSAGVCVECVKGSDCMSGVCDPTFVCAPPGCTDGVKNGDESDVDCGGTTCSPCPSGKACSVATDCKGGICTGQVCAPSCTDTELNNGESDVDCGGPNCPKCDYGKTCTIGSDCDTGNCQGMSCACVATCACDHIVISEIRTRGVGGATDEFVELFNPTASPIVLDNQWKLEVRSNSAGSYGARFTGSGQVIAPKGHLLITGSGYTQMPAGDAMLSAGITDAASLRLTQSGNVVDAVCYCYNASTCTAVTGAGYTCEGAAVQNPNGSTGTADTSMERGPGGAQGNCTDSGDSSADFAAKSPADPQNTMSAPTP